MIIKKVEYDEAQKKIQKAKSTHKQISDLVDYICAPHKVNMEEKLEYAGCRNLEGDTHAARKMEMVSLAEKSVRSKMPVSHWIMSWEEDEQPAPEQIERCVDIFLEEMELQGHQVIFGVHRNTRNMHLHIAVNRMNPRTLKVVQPHKGFDKNAGHRLMTKIEHEQGWKQTGISRYVMLENGDIVRRKREPKIKPRQKALDFEQATGEKSAQRIAQEKGHEIIANARSWEELHAALEDVGLRFEKKHRGAVIWVGDVAVKASNVDRQFSMSKLCKRLGEFQPGDYGEIANPPPEPVSSVNQEEWQAYQDERKANKEKKNADEVQRNVQKELDVYDEPSQKLKGWAVKEEKVPKLEAFMEIVKKTEKTYGKRKPCTQKSNDYGLQPLSQNRLRALSECRLAYPEGEKQKEDSTGVLPGHARADRREYCSLRRLDDLARRRKRGKRRSVATKAIPSFKDWLLLKGLRKQADLWRYRAVLERNDATKQEPLAATEETVAMCKQAELFKRYVYAVQAERVRVTCMRMSEDGEKRAFILDKQNGETRGFSPREALARMDEMRRIQSRGENIYYTPLSQDRHHILIDDMSAQSVNKLRADGFQPAVILLSSPGNFQCILTIPKLGTEFDRQVGNRLTELLNRRYGDKNLSGCIHPHRAPGFENRKPKHRREDGGYPEVKLIAATRVECPKALDLSQQLNSNLEEEDRKARERAARVRTTASFVGSPGSPIAAYHAHFNDIHRHMPIEDASRVDAMIAIRMRATGHSQADIAAAIEQCAPAIRNGEKRRNWHDYAERTANYAFGFAGDRELIQRERLVPSWRRVEGIQAPAMTPQNQQRTTRESAPVEQTKPSPAPTSPRPRLR